MHRKNDFVSGVLSYLSNEDKLSLRKVSKKHCQLVKDYQAAPYKTKAQFVIAVTGKYRFTEYTGDSYFDRANNQKYINLLKDYVKTNIIVYSKDKKNKFTSLSLINAWNCYRVTMESPSCHDALLYRLCDFSEILKTQEFKLYANGEDLIGTQRRYSPVKPTHNWDVNIAWVLAQVHKGRSFVLFSPVNENTKYRVQEHQKDEKVKAYSAFARETASVIKSGYSITNKNKQIVLTPSKNMDVKTISIDDIDVSNDEVEKTWILFSKLK